MQILHLDDHYIFTQGLNAVFEKQCPDMDVLSTMQAHEALVHLDKGLVVDLILVDLNLPDLDGLAFIQAVEQRGLFIPIVVLSASEDIWQIKQALEGGASGFIPKSYSFDEMLSAIRSVLDGEVFIPDAIQRRISQLPASMPKNQQCKLLAAYQLGQRQLDVLKLMQQGYSNEGIAQVLNVSKNTVRSHARTLFSAFEVDNRIECVRYAERVGILP